MRDERAPDYGRAKTATLQHLAAGGDQAAMRELQRRGLEVAAVVDVEGMSYLELRRRVLGWREGRSVDERDRNRDIAIRAQLELEARYRTDTKLYDGRGASPKAPPTPPWLYPREPRCAGWQRPQQSSVYPAEPATGASPRMRAHV